MQRWAILGWVMVAMVVAVAAQASPWSDQTRPSAGPPRSIGKPAAGCIAGAKALPFDGPGYQVIRLSRDRYFGHPRTVDFIESLGKKARSASLQPFYVGDIGLPRGGPMPNGHASHQIGLDVDIWFNLDPKPLLAPAERENVALPSMLTPDFTAIDPKHFDQRQVTLLRLAAQDARVDRIFVNPVIKRALCEGEFGADIGDRSWLHRLRPWYGHDDHFHVRLRCPKDSPDCVQQTPIPPGDGCDATLQWWFERGPATVSPEPVQRRMPVLPAVCRRLIER